MEGTVTEWVWSNPHCFLKFDVKEKDGTVRHWTVETSNPPDMVNRGWSRRSFKGGDKRHGRSWNRSRAATRSGAC